MFGAYSGCSSEQQLSFVVDRYYVDQNSQGYACNFSGNATVTSAAAPTGNCASLLSVAGTSGGGSVVAPTGSATYTTGSAAGAVATSGGGGAAATTTGAASGLTVPTLDFGLLHLGIYILGAALTGAGMIFL